MRRRGDRNTTPAARLAAVAALVTTTACVGTSDGLTDPAACRAPTVTRTGVTSDPSNVLRVFISATLQDADSAVIRFGVVPARDSVTPAFEVRDTSFVAPILGLQPSSSYTTQLVAFNACGAAESGVMAFSTDALPADLPTYATGGTGPTPGFVVLAAGRYGLVIDNSGRVVWYHVFAEGPGLNFQAQPNGRYTARPPTSTVGEWTEVEPGGTVTRVLGCGDARSSRMHDMIAQADGSYWLLCDEERTVDLSAQGKSATARVLGTGVRHRSASGELLFDWSPFDHLDVSLKLLEPADRDGAVINWTHGNALDLDTDGNLLVSFRNLDEVVKIDTRTGAVMWRLGGEANQFTFDNGSQEDTGVVPFAWQHGLRALGAGRIELLDNRGEPDGSRVERYEIDEARRVARLVDTYGTSEGLLATIGGSTQALSDGHMLVSFGNAARVQEYDPVRGMVWGLDGNAGYRFRAQRIRSLYQPGVGDPR